MSHEARGPAKSPVVNWGFDTWVDPEELLGEAAEWASPNRGEGGDYFVYRGEGDDVRDYEPPVYRGERGATLISRAAALFVHKDP